MHEIKIDKKTFYFPENRSEISLKESLFLSDFLFKKSHYSIEEKALEYLKFSFQEGNILKLNDIQLAQLVPFAIKIIEIPEDEDIRPLFKSFSHLFKTYHAPAANLESSVVAEFIVADDYCQKIPEQPKYLDLLMACLYRKKDSKKKHGDLRVKFDTDDLEARASKFRNVHYAIKLQCFHFFVAVKKRIAENYEELFVSDDDPNAVKGDWTETLLQIAENKVFGEMEKVKYTNLYEVLDYQLMKKRQNKTVANR